MKGVLALIERERDRPSDLFVSDGRLMAVDDLLHTPDNLE